MTNNRFSFMEKFYQAYPGSKDKIESLISSYRSASVQQQVDQLLLHTVKGEQDNVMEWLRYVDPHRLLDKTRVTDCSHRRFNSISPLQYALWALDWRMWMVMLNNSNYENEQAYETFKKIVLDQYQELKLNGMSYQLHGKTYTEQHYDFLPLINALEEYKNNFYIWSEHKRQEYWCTIIGDIQRDIPVHVAQEYCVPSSANHHAINAINKDGNEDVFQENFKNSNYYARRSLRFYDYTSGENRCWFPLPSFLGRDYAIAGEWGVAKNYIFFEQGGFKKEWPNQTAPTGGQELINLLSVQIELKAVTTLAKIRVDEFNQFEEELDMVQKRLFIKNNPKQQY